MTYAAGPCLSQGGKKPASKCDIDTLEDCSEREVAFIKKFKDAPVEASEKELKRLSGMNAKKMKAELADWLEARKILLRKLSAK